MTHRQSRAQTNGGSSRRIPFFDTIRGFTIVSMVLFHATYDATMLYGFRVDWFLNPIIQSVWRNSISWTFLLIAGVMCSFSRSNAKRALRYLVVALLIWLVTSIIAIDTPINFGIIFCMGSSVAIYAGTRSVLDRIPVPIGFGLCLLLFFLTMNVPAGTYTMRHVAWLGFPDKSFSSGDYYPLIPYSFLLLAGSYVGRSIKHTVDHNGTNSLLGLDIPCLRYIGQHPLSIYLIHQPLLIVLFELIVRFI